MTEVKNVYQYKYRIRKLQAQVKRLRKQRDSEVDLRANLQGVLDAYMGLKCLS